MCAKPLGKNFDHDPQILLEQNGYIFVGIIEPDIDVGSIKQIQIDLKDFENSFNVNIRAPFLLCGEFSQDMVKKNGVVW